MRRSALNLICIGILLSGLAWAQDPEDNDGPGRGVARISLINGDVSIRRGDSGDWMAAAVNGPMVVYDQLLTGQNSRAEIQFDYANMLRLGPDTEVRLSELDNKRYQVQVARGTVMLAVIRDSDAAIEVDTPNVAVRPVARGMYRISVNPDGESEITVRQGEVAASTPSGTERVTAGRTMLVRGTASNAEYQMVAASAWDNFDRWNQERDQRLDRSQSYRYVSNDIYGADDLDSYGRWVNVAPYGMVWSPYGVGADWAPYRYGRWSWVDWYGWTWISYDPWGWAPFHYGRWFYDAPYGWCWFPGAFHARHYWSPGLVAFFGFGNGVGFGFGFGNIGWVPLAPYERYYPWYGHRYYAGYRGGNYYHGGLHIAHNTNIYGGYRNARVRNGLSGIGSHDFVNGRRARSIGFNDAGVRRASLVRGGLPVAPGTGSQRLTDRRFTMPNVRGRQQTQFFSQRQAPRVNRVPFRDQQRGMEQAVRSAFSGNRGRGEAASGPATQSGRSSFANGARSNPTASGWRSTGQQSTGPVVNRDSNWRRFGDSTNRSAGPIGTTPRQGRSQVREVAPRNNQNWSQFSGRSETRQQAAPRQDSNSNWNRFGTWRNDSSPGGRQQIQRQDTNRNWDRIGSSRGNSAPTMRQERQQMPRMERSQPIRINPPIVRQRSAPRSQGGGSYRSMPQRSSGGGGARSSGGGGRSSGGRSGGGGSRSGGGRRR
jgi:hypothetical protein